MRFAIKQAGCGSERVGCLSGFLKSQSFTIETPTSAIITQGGSVVHLTADVLARVFVNPQLLWVPLSNSVHLEKGLKAQGEGIAKFAALPDHIACATLHNASEATPSGHFESDKVPLWTKHGKKMITAERYMDLMELFKPEMILAIADGHTSLNEPLKRLTKSVDRTANMLDVCVNRYKASKELRNSALIGVIVAAGHEKKCKDSIKHLEKYKDDLSGVALAGITDGSEESFKEPIDKIQDVLKRVSDNIPKDLLHIIEGAWNPAIVVEAIEQGWDLFDGSYPLRLTNAGQALALNLNLNRSCDDLCILDLSDVRYKESFKPILEDCECLTCKKHTRAYIRHLLNTREMLASVLLGIHNVHHFDQMFHHARRHIAEKSFVLFKSHITEQYELYKRQVPDVVNLEEKKETSGVEKAEAVGVETLTQKKKICVSNGTVQNCS